jgi:hypothetical protein
MMQSVTRRTYLQLFGFLGLTAVVLWPEPSYYDLLRYGTVPTILTALPYLLPGAALVTALYLGVTEPPEERELPTLSARILLTAATILSLCLPYAILALLAARVTLLRMPLLLAVLLPGILFYHALGLFFARTISYPTLRHLIAWSAGALLLPVTAVYLPAANPVIAAANAAGSARLLSGGLWVPVITPFPFVAAAGLPLLGAGILTTVVVLWKR